MKTTLMQLQEWSNTVTELSVTPVIAEKLGVFLDEAKRNESLVSVYLFSYTVSGVEVTAFIVIPKNMPAKMPVILFNRGGTGNFGLVPHGQYFTRIARMAQWGYIVIGSFYPGNAYSEGTDERGGKSDVESVLRLYDLITYLESADESRIGMYGESRGGMMTYLCLQTVPWIKAALTVGGSTNLERTLQERPEMEEVFAASFDNTHEALRDRSVVHWADRLHKTPLCLLHGSADVSVSPLDAIELAGELHKYSHPFSLHIFEDGNHGLTNYSMEKETLIKTWYGKYLQ